MPLAQADRIAFSANVVAAPALAASLDLNKAAIQKQIDALTNLDTANSNLFATPNNLINLYHPELAYLTGNVRTSIVEQDIQDAANKILGNHFFPNNTSVSVPSLSGKNNIWSQIVPYALGYCIGKNYSEAYGVQANPELTLIATILGYTNLTDPSVVQASVTTYKATLQTMVALIPTTDTNPTNSANNAAAISNINTVIIPALNTYLAATHPVYNPVTPVADTSFAPMATAVTTRQTFANTRVSQITTILGSISQDIATGNITASSGAYASRYNTLLLRLHALSGSLSQIANLRAGTSAQTALKTSALANAATYSSYVPTSLFKSDGNNLNIIHVVNSSLFSVGDLVYVMADGQTELLRAVKTINNDVLTLNDVVPASYTVSNNARIYKDLT